jgi:xanthine/CO dehydrogenase XdhC/CoxF family maturation factor
VTVQPAEDRHLLVVGDGPVSDALESLAAVLGWATTVARTTEEVAAGLASSTAVVVTSHHDELDAPAIALSLAAAGGAGPAYVAAMGSRRTQARRREWLLAHGVPEAALEALHAPAGLDIGADTPAEIALSVLAELVATVRGVSPTGSLRDRSGPIHPGLGPGEAVCPAG